MDDCQVFERAPASKSKNQLKREAKQTPKSAPSGPLNVLSELKDKPVAEIQKIYRENMNADKVCCLNLQSNANAGMIIRTANIFAMSEVIILGRRKFDPRATVGADNYMDVTRIDATVGTENDQLDIPKILAYLTHWSQTHSIVFVELSPHAIDLREMNKNVAKDKPVMFILGAENEGIPTEILQFKPSICVQIPQKGVIPCFNVSIAFSIVASMYYFTERFLSFLLLLCLLQQRRTIPV